ncbi:MAG: hypothetical protein ABSA57_14745 [Candidatus Acidiferrales bacterium]
MSDPNDELPRLIRCLSDPDSAARETAATEIFARGCELARPAVERWLADEELARCLVLGASRTPEETVGLAVMPDTFESIRGAFGSPPLADVPPDQDALEFEVSRTPGFRLDILTTAQRQGAGAIARFLRKFGEGIQQIELLVRSVENAAQILRARFGIMPLFPAPRAGASGRRVNFFLLPLPAGGKVLIELVEATALPHGLC